MGRSVANILKVNPVRPLRLEDKTWLAAAIDGEGTITFSVSYRKNTRKERTLQANPTIQMPNLSAEFCQHAHDLTGVGSIYTYVPPQPNLSVMFRWQVRRYNEVFYLLAEIEPYLIIKREQAKNVLAFIRIRAATPRMPWVNTFTTQQLEFIEAVSQLNGASGKSKNRQTIGEYRRELARKNDLRMVFRGARFIEEATTASESAANSKHEKEQEQ